ncbi:N-6 DNA methylase [Clostridium sp. CX1]|uniref:N-6 DNA methylase n=1 Tax=Clostridium sp. CX1 TaxID=2978346 RepID=UPI0021C21CBA|nr:N-6 DNA methylase [Clostridium sp. CX1]MCT8977876.1 N-6 DNA methylase [Clostridium sp. CX1]
MEDIYYICDIKATLENVDSLNKNVEGEKDLVVFNPPYSTKLSVQELAMEELKDRKINRISMESAFLLKAIQYAKKGGVIAATIPSSFLFNVSNKPIRDIILEKIQVLMILDAPKRTFENSAVSVSIIVLKKKQTNGEKPKELLVASLEDFLQTA